MQCASHMTPEAMLQAKLSTLQGESGENVWLPLEVLGTLTNSIAPCVRTRARTQKTQLRLKQAKILMDSCGLTIKASDLKYLWPIIAQDIYAMQEILRLDWRKAQIPLFKRREIRKVLAPYLRHYADNLSIIRSLIAARPTGLSL